MLKYREISFKFVKYMIFFITNILNSYICTKKSYLKNVGRSKAYS